MAATGQRFRPLDSGGRNGGHEGARSPSSSSLTADLTFDAPAAPAAPAAPPPPRVLTKPADPAVPGGCDNANDNLIVSVGDVFVSSLGTRYVVEDLLGQGTFGQVFRCAGDDGEAVAVKVIKNQAAYYHQARVEIGILQFLNTRADPDDAAHIVRLRDFFLHKNHLCLVFELLNLNLFELVRHNKFRGLSLSLVRVFVGQVLQALVALAGAAVIHCDIKPENILLTDATSGEVKLIDFGSACFANRTVYTYIQSRFYRAPEVVLGHPYTAAVDMWSLGCVAAELFLGLPLFPAASELDLLARVTETVGPLPPGLLAAAKNTDKFYTPGLSTPGLRLRTPEEFVEANGVRAPRGKQYFQHRALADIVNAYPFKPGMDEGELLRERASREAFTDFLLGLLDVDPHSRWTPRQAATHPFITGDLFAGPFQPASDPTAGVPRAVAVGIPVGIPAPRSRAQAAASLDGLTAALLASSPQMHAQAHAAAMAAVRLQMNLQQQQQQQQGRSIPAAAAAVAAAAAASPYVAAHSLQRIMDPATASMLGRTPSEGSELAWGRPGAPPLSSSMFSPPSRSFGVHLAPSAPELPPPSFDPGHYSPHRIVPLTHLPAAGSEPLDTSPVAFQPSSVSTFRSALAAAAAATAAAPPAAALPGGSGDKKVAGGSSGASAQQAWATGDGPRSSGGGSTPQRKPSAPPQAAEEAPPDDPADWDPLWSDDLLAEEERSPGPAAAQQQQQERSVAPDNGLSLAMAHLTQLQHLTPPAAPGGQQQQAASWPVGQATSPGALPQGGSGGGGPGAEAMLWSPPRAVLAKAPGDPAAAPAPHGHSHQEPLQRLQGFVVADEGPGAEEKQDDA